ncbi:patatin-like phospholipase family protein [Marinimicrobium sp. C2-29]|uniref:patatin-like phospholipase family protein n=1 Tax=Marinimicrobium sp. C2-29 TaxID=3139825 RepID=UPI003138743C
MNVEQPGANDPDTFLSSREGERISLVLSSGGARGLAHIGVIRELEARGYRIDTIAGCSMGSLVGGLYALGRMEDFAGWVSSLERKDILGLLDITSNRGGFIGGNKIMAKLHEWTGDARIEDLPISYTAVAVDLEREREVWMNEGSLYEAIRASISIPGVFTPHLYRDRILVDGSVLNPIPVAPTLHRLTDKMFVVDANGPPADEVLRRSADPEEDEDNNWLRKVLGSVGWGSSSEKSIDQKLDVISVMMRSLDTMQAALTRQHLAVFHPDCVFRVPRNLCMIHEFHRAEEIMDFGRAQARRLLDDAELERRQWP